MQARHGDLLASTLGLVDRTLGLMASTLGLVDCPLGLMASTLGLVDSAQEISGCKSKVVWVIVCDFKAFHSI